MAYSEKLFKCIRHALTQVFYVEEKESSVGWCIYGARYKYLYRVFLQLELV